MVPVNIAMDSSPVQCAQTYLDLWEAKACLLCLSPWFVCEHSFLLCVLGILTQYSFGDIWEESTDANRSFNHGTSQRRNGMVHDQEGLQNFPELFAQDPPL